MNIAPSSPSTTGRADPGAAAAAASLDGGTDPAAQPGSPLPAFGRLLSKNLADGDAAQASGHDAAASARDTALGDAADAVRDALAPGAAPAVATATKPDPTATTAAARSAKDDDATDDDANPLGSDLAAQLALVSQWAGLGPQGAAATAAGGPTADTLDIKGKLDAVRGAAPKVADPTTTEPTTPGRSSGAAEPLATTGATRAAVAALPGLSTAIAAALRSGDAKSTDAVKAVAAKTGATDVPTTAASVIAHAAEADTSSGGAAFGQGGSQTPAQFAAQMAAQIGAQMTSQVGSSAAVSSTGVQSPPSPVAGGALTEQVGTAAWSHEVGQATLRMAANDLQNVSLRLNPEHLGPMDVQMRVDNGVAHLQFAAAHVETRQALEASRTTLHQMFNDQGIKLGDWSVGQQSAHASGRDAGSARAQSGARDGAATDDADTSVVSVTAPIRTRGALGLVDTFA